MLADAIGQNRLADFALRRLLATLIGRQQHVSHQLLGDRGRAALAFGLIREIGIKRPRNRSHIHAWIDIKISVFDRNRRSFEIFGKRAESYDRALARAWIENLVQQGCAVASIDLGRFKRAMRSECRTRRQIAPEIPIRAHARADRQNHQQQSNLQAGDEQFQPHWASAAGGSASAAAFTARNRLSRFSHTTILQLSRERLTQRCKGF